MNKTQQNQTASAVFKSPRPWERGFRGEAIIKAAVAALLILSFHSAFSQTTPQITTVLCETRYVTDTTGLSNDSLALQTLPLKAVVDITVTTTNTLTGIVLSIGSSEGANNIFFNVYQLSNPNSPFGTLTVSGNQIHIETAQFPQQDKQYCTVALELPGHIETENTITEAEEQ